MARSVEQQLSALRALDATAPGAADELRKALRTKNGLVVAAAAKRAGEHRLVALVEDLAAAFAPLIEDKKKDPGSRGKIAIARALHDMDEWDDRVFVGGLRVVQSEGDVDTAGELRGICGLAHVHFFKPDALDVLAMLLADPERNARIAAAQGLGDSGRPDATALLRYMLLLGIEHEPEVLATCFDALFALARDASADFAIELLAGTDDRAEAAAIALGSARVATACEPLVAWCGRCKPEQRRRVGYIALALLRSDAANAALLDAIRTKSSAEAVAAAKALATFKEDAAIAASLREVLSEVDAATRREIEALLR